VLNLTGDQLVEAWHSELRATYRPVLERVEAAGARAPLLVGEQGLRGELNVGPAISPDGRWVAFLSERDLFSVDLFIADATTGQVTKRVTSTAFDQHLSSLQFIASSGSWDADSRRLIFTALGDGKPRLVVFDVTSGRNVPEIRLDELDDVFPPTWSPDGRAVAFAGMVGGFTDLFVYNIADSRLRRLTHDSYAVLQPAWSPDGRRIAFATDRFTTDLPTLDAGPYRLATIDIETGTIAQVRGSMSASTSTRSGQQAVNAYTFSQTQAGSQTCTRSISTTDRSNR
jgi:Tol biopolymer transport system component